MTSRKYNVAIVGATGAVGEVLLEILAERHFPIQDLYLLASARSVGETREFQDQQYILQDVAEFDFSQAEFAFFSAGSSVSAKYAPIAAQAGCVVIDNTSHFRYEEDIPLVVPEVNPEALLDYRLRNIIANPNCSTIQMLVALKPIYDAVGIHAIHVATYQAVSGAGRLAIEELGQQSHDFLRGHEPIVENFPCTIAFNAIPQIDVFLDNGYTREEMKMFWETQKILNDPHIRVNATTVRVPVFYGHSEAIFIETREAIDAQTACQLLEEAPGVVLLDEANYPTAVTHAAGQDAVFVGRVRQDLMSSQGLNLWVVSDNLRKGAALNAIQIAELLVEMAEVKS